MTKIFFLIFISGHSCVCGCARARARVCVCVCVCMLRPRKILLCISEMTQPTELKGRSRISMVWVPPLGFDPFSKELKIRCLVQWYSQEGQDVGHGHKPREGNIYGEKYILNFVTERKSLLTGGKSVLANKKIMPSKTNVPFKILRTGTVCRYFLRICVCQGQYSVGTAGWCTLN